MTALEQGSADLFRARLPELVEVYRQAFLEVYEADPAQAAKERAALMQRHAHREGLRLVIAEEPDGRIIGFCYTYHGRHGQWWHDVVVRALGPDAGRRWLGDCREVVELHVLPEAQGHGLGRRLLRAALDGSAERTSALSALDIRDTRARRLYVSEGFQEVLRGFRFPGTNTEYVIFAKDLPPLAG